MQIRFCSICPSVSGLRPKFISHHVRSFGEIHQGSIRGCPLSPNELCTPLYVPSIMTSLFEHINKNLIKELGGKDLRPIQNPLSANKFCLLNLLRQKRRTLSQFWKQPDVPVDCILMDILEPSPSVPDSVNQG